MELILRAANISTTLPEPDLNTSTSPQLSHLLISAPNSGSSTPTMHNMQPPTNNNNNNNNSPTTMQQHSSSLPGGLAQQMHHSASASLQQQQQQQQQQQHSSSVPPGTGTLHHLLKTHHAHQAHRDSSSPMAMSSSVDSPRRMDIRGSIEEDDCVLMEGD